MARRKGKGGGRWCWAQFSPRSPISLGHCAGGTVGTRVLSPLKSISWNTSKLIGMKQMINICKFYFVWNVVGWSPWKCECFSFSHYLIENVTSWTGRESKSEHSASGEMHRKFHLQSEFEIGNIRPTETPPFANWPLKTLSYVQKLAFNRTTKFPQSMSVWGVGARDLVCQLCSVTLDLVKPFPKRTEAQSPHPRQ